MKTLLFTFLISFSLYSNNFEQGYKEYNNGNYQLAKQLFSEAIKENPNNAELYYNRALAELKLNQYDEAQKDFKKANEIIN